MYISLAHLYFNEDYPEALTEFKRLCNADTSFYNLSAISDDIVANDYPVSRDLYNKYTGNLRRAVDAVFSGDDADTDLALRLKAGVTRFGAFKAFNATQDIRTKGRSGAATAADDAENVEKRYNSFQAAEYATAASRARTAKQFAEYMTADRMRLFPNLRWLPSRSVEVRPEHRIFWNRVWPKTSDFWQKNQPGNLWNCKCDMEETDDPTDIPEKLNPKYSSASPGLKGNPAVTGKIFSDDCSYISKLKDTDRQYVESYVKPVLDRCEEYIKYKNDAEYKDCNFDWATGALKARHIDHIIHTHGELFFGNMTTTMLEQECQNELYRLGHKAILEKEIENDSNGNRLTALDLTFNNERVDIASITGNGYYGWQMYNKNNQIEKWNARPDVTIDADSLILYFHDPSMFSETKMQQSIPFFLEQLNKNGKQQLIKKVYCVIKGSDNIKIYNI